MSKLVRKNPFNALDSIFKNDLFTELFQEISPREYVNVPRTNVVQTPDGSRIDIEAPGMRKDDFKIEIDGDQLTVSAHVEKKEKNEFYRRSFSHSWTLHPGTIHDRISASYVDGILRVDVPAKEVPSQKKTIIDIK